MLESGKILQDRYRIEKQIGQGGMGAVYVAVDQRFGSTVAIKETLFLGEHFEKAFEREARLLNSLRHPALPNVRDYFSEEHNQYLVMEFISGEDLSEKLEKNGQAFELEEVLNWSKQLLKAIDFLHTQEIPVIHRDIKPQNLKLTPQGQIILLDFGLAKGNPTDASHLTNAKSIFGYSRNYASLEQMQGTGTDPRSDLYSLAATVYHLATGIPPVDALTRATSVLSEQADPLVSANQVHEQVSKGIANILNNAMNLNANQRPASAKEMLEMLENSEEYEDLENHQVVISKAVPTGFLNQETQILPVDNLNLTANANRQFSTGEGELETEVNKNKYSSKNYETNVVTANLFDKPKPRSRKPVYAIAAVLSLLLTVIGTYALFFLDDHRKTDGQNLLNNTEAEKIPAVAEVKTENANLNIENVNSTAETETATENIEKPVVKSTNQEKSKPVISTGKNIETQPDDSEFVIVDPEEGRVVFKGNTIETDKVIINDKGIVYKKPPVPPRTPRTPNVNAVEIYTDQPKQLTPRQIKRLNQIRSDMERRRKIMEARKKAEVTSPPTPE
jgi:serine/threonine protein kinase